MGLWISAAVAFACIYAVALGLWPILINQIERDTRWLTYPIGLAMGFIGLIVVPWSDTYAARWVRVLLSILGILVGSLAAAYWQSSRRRCGFEDYARFIFLGLLNPNLIHSAGSFAPQSRASVPRELLRMVTAFGVGTLAVFIGGRLLSEGDARSWVVNYLIAVAAFLLMMQSFGQMLLAWWHLMGFHMRPVVNNVWLSRTPAEFWRRWSPPAHLALYRYAYLPFGGRARPICATFWVFLASAIAHEVLAGVGLVRITGHQFVFFMVSSLGVMASPWLERLAKWGIAGDILMRSITAAFMLTTGTLMFATFNHFVPMYREPAWLAW